MKEDSEEKSLTDFWYYFSPSLSLAKLLILWQESGPLVDVNQLVVASTVL